MRGHLGLIVGVVASATTTAAVTAIDAAPAAAYVAAGERRCAPVTAGQPGDLAVVNLTPIGASGPGHGQLLASDVVTPPVASNVNFGPGTVDPNVAIAPIGVDGQVCFVNSALARVDIVLDQLMAIKADAFTPTASGAPERVTDTRVGLNGPPLRPNERRCMSAGAESGALAFVNLLPLNATAPGHGVLVPSDDTDRPSASSVNFRPGSIDPNLAVALVGDDHQVCFVNSEHAEVDLVADVLGTIDAGAFSSTATGAPVRLVDTRSGLGGGRLTASEVRCVETDVTPGDIAIVNVLPLDAAAPGYGALGSATISNVNVAPGSVDPNLAFAPVDAQGRLCYANSKHGAVELVADLLATIPATSTVAAVSGSAVPSRLLDSRPGVPAFAQQVCPSATRCYRIVEASNSVDISDDGGRTWRHTLKVKLGFVW